MEIGCRQKRKMAVAVFLFLIAVSAFWVLSGALRRENEIGRAEASSGIAAGDTVLLGGMPVGIYMETDGVMVLSTESLEGTDGEEYEPAADPGKNRGLYHGSEQQGDFRKIRTAGCSGES